MNGESLKTPHKRRPPRTELRHRMNAGRVVLKQQVDFFRAQFANVTTHWKDDDTRVTFADFAISEKLITGLRADFPGDDFCSEESNPQDEVMALRADFAWVLDPIDGTNNFYLGMPMCAISLALLYEGVPVYGFVYDHSRNCLIEGGPSQPLMVDGKRLNVADEPFGEHGICALHFPMSAPELEAVTPLLTERRIRGLGSGTLNLAWAATGLIDGVVDFHVKVWDIAAGHALIQAAERGFAFISPPCFPLTEFHPNAPVLKYFAGSESFMKYARPLLANLTTKND